MAPSVMMTEPLPAAISVLKSRVILTWPGVKIGVGGASNFGTKEREVWVGMIVRGQCLTSWKKDSTRKT
jgi:hypothetical protein